MTNDGPICAGEVLNLSETGGQAVSWSWDSDASASFVNNSVQFPVVNGATHGETFTVTITDMNGCQSTCQTTVTVHDIPICSATADTICLGDSLTTQ